jgi:O-6-methylguanine DNA methyltransferase
MNENYSSKQNLYINNKKAKELVSQIFESNKAPDIILKGTPFQIQVWNELSSIPRATTTTYGKIAKAIGQAKSARAVANAIGANPIALLIPCHRVIRSDGSLGGYKWGVNLKRDILQWELDNTKII